MAVITISRQFGAGGRTLGQMVANELGYTFADDAIIQMVAEAANVSPHWVESIEKEAGTALSKVIMKLVSKSLVSRVLHDERGYIDEKIYLDYLVVIIAQLAEEGDVVILGRGSQYILDDHPDAYHFLLLDGYESRVKFIMQHYDIGRDKAAQIVRTEDKRRANLYRRLSKSDYDDPSLYHMTINRSRVSLEDALQTVCSLVRD